MAIKARDIRVMLKGVVDPRLSQILEGLAEEQGSMQKVIAELTSVLMMAIETVEKMGLVNENLKTALEKQKRMEDQHPELGSVSTTTKQ